MIIKKFQGKTEEEAIETAKKELGQNVVIMNVKTIKKKGLFSFLKSQLVEVTAALEEETNPFASITKEILKSGTGKRESTFREDVPKVSLKEEENAGSMLEEKLDSIQLLIEQQLHKSDNNRIKEHEILSEQEEPDEMVVFMQLLYNTMINNEVNEKYANQIIDEVEKNSKSNMPIDYVLSNIYQKIILKFGKPESIMPAKEGPKIVFFVGPTGVGKTTTIAKVASKFCVEQKKKIVLLTADTYRIAAAEQLRTYANILDVPFRVVYSAEDAKDAFRDFHAYDYIFVDTAGHSCSNTTLRENVNELIHCVDDKIEREVYLVLSATTKYCDLISIADAYTPMTKYKLIFTKLDETILLGNLLNLKLHTGASLSYVTCGQNVPDDIETFNPQDTVRILLGGRR